MRSLRDLLYLWLTGLVISPSLSASTGNLSDLQQLPLRTNAQGVHVLPAGTYRGNFVIAETATVECAEGAVIDANGHGHALTLAAPHVRLRGCHIQNWGKNLTNMDAGLFVARKAAGAVIESNLLQGSGFGIWLDATPDVTVRGNRVQGDPNIRSQDRGNGIHMFNTQGALVVNNEVSHTRDGIYIEAADGNELQSNFLHDLRYGIHYMYSQNNRITGNHTTRTRTGYALMQSRNLQVIGNLSVDDENYGILLNYITYSTLQNNYVDGVRQGTGAGGGMIAGAEGKALFVYNSVFNTIEHNYFGKSNLGIHLTAGSEDNQISRNAFVHNQHQVKYVATRSQEWSVNGIGNFWSDYLGWDRNNDSIGDIPYEPNDNVDRLLWTYPQARLLMHSPAVEMLRLAQQAFPVIKAQGVRDSAPMMTMPGIQPPSTKDFTIVHGRP